MSAGTLVQKVRSLFRNVIPPSRDQEIQALKEEIECLRSQLRGSNGGPFTIIQKEIEILRNEIQENIAAIHRLEILTLRRRIELLTDFGKTLHESSGSNQRKSFKPEGYSFGIITNGQRQEKFRKLIGTIEKQGLNRDRFEILVAGSVNDLTDIEWITKFPMQRAATEGRLGAMRNTLAKNARFNKFVSLDDDFLLHPRWAVAVDEVQDDFDVATGIILNPDLSRYCDWVNIIENHTFLRAYHETFDKCQYVTGGYGIYKDFVLAEHSWNGELGFYQGEDVSFSKRLFDAGYQLKFIPKAIVMHDDERYRQKGYGVIRLKHADNYFDYSEIGLRLEKLCPRTLS
jgi:hypothetical protein